MKDKLILYRDSIKNRDRANDCMLVKKYIVREFENRNSREMTKEEIEAWKYEKVITLHQQPNGYDCGMYTCAYAYFILLNRVDQFEQKDIDDLRMKFSYSILQFGNTMFEIQINLF